MKILELTELNSTQTNQIEHLVKLSNRHTSSEVTFNNLLNYYPSMNSWFLAYRGEHFAGYISLFAPGTDKSELSAHIHPEMRGQGVFTSLCAAAAREMLKYGYRQLLFLCPHDSIPGKAVAARCGAAYVFTEYMMRYDRSRPVTPSRNRLTIIEASHNQAAELIALGKSVFPDTSGDGENMIKSRLNLPNWKIMVGTLRGDLIGICSVGFEQDSLSINGFGIEP